ncbi:VanW family protein [Lysinibacillus sp. NPDC058147]|uniref:VanW family protein n=1 Tax=unclassified Lysinibacillus TaxID=2636778 RepID=UPI0036DD1243
MKRFITLAILLIGTVIIVAVCLPNFILNGTVFAKGEIEGSTIGGIEIEGIKLASLELTLQSAVTDWQETEMEVSGEGNVTTIDSKQITFDIEAAIAQFESQTKKPWYAFWQKEKIVHIPIPVTLSDSVTQKIESVAVWETDKTLNNITMQASYLRNHEVEAVINNEFEATEERIAFQIADIPSEVQGISKIISSLNEVMIGPDQSMSMLTLLGENADEVNKDGLDFVASMLYSVLLQTDYEILERHSQQVIPSYLQQGIEADVNPLLGKDLQFINKSNKPGKLKTTLEGNKLKIEIFAPTKDKDITVRVSKDKIVKPRIIYRYTDDLKVGRERVEQEGQEGVRIEVYRSIVENGATKEQLVSKDYYAPQNRIVTRSSKEPVPVTAPTPKDGTSDPDLQMDLNGDGLPDTETSSVNSTQKDGPEIVYGYYDKGGNFVQTSP